MNRTLKLVAALALIAMPVAAQNQPIVSVFAFENGAFGTPGAKDYDNIGKGIMDMVITDLASSGKVRVVERARIDHDDFIHMIAHTAEAGRDIFRFVADDQRRREQWRSQLTS